MKTKKRYVVPFTLQDIILESRYSDIIEDNILRSLSRLYNERVWLENCFKLSGRLYESFYSPFGGYNRRYNLKSIKEIVFNF